MKSAIVVGCATVFMLALTSQGARAHTPPPAPEPAKWCQLLLPEDVTVLLEPVTVTGTADPNRDKACEEAIAELIAETHEDAPDSQKPVRRPAAAPRPRTVPGSVESWRVLVESHFGPETDTALCILWHESRGDPGAVNPSSGASGLFQHLPRYWSERSAKAGVAGADIFDPTANVIVAAWLQRVGGWKHWSPWNRGECR